MTINLYAAWIGISLGVVAGLIAGLFFHREDFLGGYGSWPRRLMRLGHVSLFGLALLNLAFFGTARLLPVATDLSAISWLFLIGAITMPLVCYTSAFVRPARHLFFIPVLSVAIGAVLFTGKVLGY